MINITDSELELLKLVYEKIALNCRLNDDELYKFKELLKKLDVLRYERIKQNDYRSVG